MGLTDVHEVSSMLSSGIQEWSSDSKIGFVKCRKRFNCLSD